MSESRIKLNSEELQELIGLFENATERLRELASESLEWSPLSYQNRGAEVLVGYWRRLPDAEGWMEVEVKPIHYEVERWEDHRPLRWLWRKLKEHVEGRLWVSRGYLHITIQPDDDESLSVRRRRLEEALKMMAWALWALKRSLPGNIPRRGSPKEDEEIEGLC